MTKKRMTSKTNTKPRNSTVILDLIISGLFQAYFEKFTVGQKKH